MDFLVLQSDLCWSADGFCRNSYFVYLEKMNKWGSIKHSLTMDIIFRSQQIPKLRQLERIEMQKYCVAINCSSCCAFCFFCFLNLISVENLRALTMTAVLEICTKKAMLFIFGRLFLANIRYSRCSLIHLMDLTIQRLLM